MSRFAAPGTRRCGRRWIPRRGPCQRAPRGPPPFPPETASKRAGALAPCRFLGVGCPGGCGAYSTGHSGRQERPPFSAGQILILRLPLTVGPFLCFFFPLGLSTIPLPRCPLRDIFNLARR